MLGIGYLQWHFKLHGKRTPPEPILRAFQNIQCRDAVLAYDGEPHPVTWAVAMANPNLPGLPDEVRLLSRPWATLSPARSGGEGRGEGASDVITVWDRRSMKTDLVTGRPVPDETKRVPLVVYANPRPPNGPPRISSSAIRRSLATNGCAKTWAMATLKRCATYPQVPESADFVLYWWHKAATLVRAGKAQRFGLITTNSLRQTFARRVVQLHLEGRSGASADRRKLSAEVQNAALCRDAATKLSLVFANPDHPWVDTAEGAAVRIAMTVGAEGDHPGELWRTRNQ